MVKLIDLKNMKPKHFYKNLKKPTDIIKWMSDVNGPHRLYIPNPQKVDFLHKGIKVGETTFGTIQYATLVNIAIDDLQNCYVINVPTQGIQEIKINSATIYSSNQTAAIFSPHQAFSMILEPDCQKKMVRISKKKVEKYLSLLLGYKITQPLIFDIQAAMQGSIKNWFNLAINLEEFLLNYESLLDFQNIWDNFENNLISILLNSQQHNYSLELERRLKGKPSYLNHLETIFKENLSQPLTLTELEKTLGVSRERLYHDFNTYYGQSPVAYLRNLRFEETYRRLNNTKPWENVSSIAMDCGFQQLGRFSQEYKNRFGELPSETLKKNMH